MKRMILRWQVWLVAVALVFVAGCGFQDGAVTVPITLSETQVNQLIQQAQVQAQSNGGEGGQLLQSIDTLEFVEPNIVRVNGSYTEANSGQTIEGSFDLAFTVNDQRLNAQVTAVNIPGISMDSPIVQNMNQRLNEAFSQAATAEQAGSIQSVQVSGQSLEIVIAVPLQQ